MNTKALKHTLRGITPWFLLAVTGLYIFGAVKLHQDQGQALFWAVLFGGMSLMTFRWRYSDFVEEEKRQARTAEYVAERERKLAEHQATLDGIEARRKAREAQLEAEYREAILSGARCPEGCEGCEREDRERREETARFLRERAARHGQPAADVLASYCD